MLKTPTTPTVRKGTPRALSVPRALRTHQGLWALLCLLVPLSLAAAAPRLAAESTDSATQGTEDPLVYAVDGVDGKLLRLESGEEWHLAAGDRVIGGSELRTGWFSSADLTAQRALAHFHLDSRTHVRLASETPGVLLVLEHGRLRALFDKLTGTAAEEERRIETPSAVLAVRGTEYGVAVDRGGETTVVVFEGVVEVLDPTGRAKPVRVKAGHGLQMRRGEGPRQPFSHNLNRRGWDRGAMPPSSRRSGPAGVRGSRDRTRTGPHGAGPPRTGSHGKGL